MGSLFILLAILFASFISISTSRSITLGIFKQLRLFVETGCGIGATVTPTDLQFILELGNERLYMAALLDCLLQVEGLH